jgi:ParB-like chromosome segregation protein Spo0J
MHDLFAEQRVHSLAAIFPMLAEDELLDLAEDIKTNGLLHPIIRTVDGVIIDGRNRLAACEMAGVAPRFDDCVESDDQARAIILSANITRRHLTKSQQAMAHAMLYPEPKRGMHSELRGATRDVSKTRLSVARTILHDAPDLAPLVLAGAMSLDGAMAEVTKCRATKVQDRPLQL